MVNEDVLVVTKGFIKVGGDKQFTVIEDTSEVLIAKMNHREVVVLNIQAVRSDHEFVVFSQKVTEVVQGDLFVCGEFRTGG